MPRLIDADALLEHVFKNDISYNAFKNLVSRQPTIEAIPIDYLLARVEAQETHGRSGATTFLRRVIKEWREDASD